MITDNRFNIHIKTCKRCRICYIVNTESEHYHKTCKITYFAHWKLRYNK